MRPAARQHGLGAAARRAAAAPAHHLLHTRHIQLPVRATGSATPRAGRSILRGGLPATLAAARHTTRPTGAVGAARGVGARAAVRAEHVADHGARARGGVARAAAALGPAALRAARTPRAPAAPLARTTHGASATPGLSRPAPASRHYVPPSHPDRSLISLCKSSC